MSYHIFYRSLAIAVPNGKFIIVSESGDNNVWECSGRRQRRARDWQSDVLISNRHNGFYTDLATITNQLNGMEQSRRENPYDPADKNAALGWFEGIALSGKHTSATYAKDMIAFYRKAIKNAKTIEEYREFGVTFSIRTGSDVQHGKDYQVRSTDDLVKYIAEFGQEFAGQYYVITATVPDNSWANLHPKKVRVARVNEGNFVIRINDGYYVRGTGRGVKYSWLKSHARRMSETVATKLVAKLQPKYKTHNFTTEKY